ncbi:MAG: thioesterase [Euryarchaeota archaeon]|nr:thioesterase [Euryarchaeota archaeon]|tara:strand:+ start:1812 stop:2282 length:471 start_codon:yes stop_codon:yes gene_type:complete
MSELIGVQKKFAPNSICFGCGPANKKGLKIDSHRIEGGLITEFKTNLEHQAFPGIINGGIIGTLLDCHGNWTAAIAIMDNRGDERPSCTVTANYSVKLIRPTPFNETLIITSEVVELLEDRAKISMKLFVGEKLCAKGEGLFVSVKEGHPAYHRWH